MSKYQIPCGKRIELSDGWVYCGQQCMGPLKPEGEHQFGKIHLCQACQVVKELVEAGKEFVEWFEGDGTHGSPDYRDCDWEVYNRFQKALSRVEVKP